MHQYLNLLQLLLDEGNHKSDRTGTGTLSIFGHQMRFDLSKGFPLLTTKKIYMRAIIHELLWFISGNTNARVLQHHGIHIWDEWADDNGDLGPIYGHQWRSFGGDPWGPDQGVDQLADVVTRIQTNPDDRRLIVSAWNPMDLSKMALPPCHCFFQFYVFDGRLSCHMYQRSCDTFLGVPFNIASYALLTHLVARHCRLHVGDLVWSGGDVHLYKNHIEQARLQLTREPGPLPKIILYDDRQSTNFDLFKCTPGQIVLGDYFAEPNIAAPISV